MKKTEAKITETRRVVAVDRSFIIYNRNPVFSGKNCCTKERNRKDGNRNRKVNPILDKREEVQKLKSLRWEKNENITSSEKMAFKLQSVKRKRRAVETKRYTEKLIDFKRRTIVLKSSGQNLRLYLVVTPTSRYRRN